MLQQLFLKVATAVCAAMCLFYECRNSIFGYPCPKFELLMPKLRRVSRSRPPNYPLIHPMYHALNEDHRTLNKGTLGRSGLHQSFGLAASCSTPWIKLEKFTSCHGRGCPEIRCLFERHLNGCFYKLWSFMWVPSQ